jgi:hypothetical protein
VAFDDQQSGVPVTWVVASQNISFCIVIRTLELLVNRFYQLCPNWKVNTLNPTKGHMVSSDIVYLEHMEGIEKIYL